MFIKNKGNLEYLKTHSINKEIYHDLFNEKYDIFYKKEDDNFVYFANRKDIINEISLSNFIIITLDKYGNIINNDSLENSFENENALLAYLYEIEDQTNFEETYKDEDENFFDFISLDDEQKEDFIKTIYKFKNLVHDCYVPTLSKIDELYTIQYEITYEQYFYRYELSFKIKNNKGKERKIKNLSDFIYNFLNKESFTNRAFEILTDKSYYSDEDYDILTKVLSFQAYNYYNYISSSKTYITSNGVAFILTKNLGKKIIYDGKEYLINPNIEKTNFSFDENGEIIYPNLPSNNMKIFGKKLMAHFDGEKSTIQLYEFEDERLCKLAYISNIFNEKEKKIIKENLIKEIQKSSHFSLKKIGKYKINYYVDLNDNGYLETKTVFLNNDNDIDYKDFQKSNKLTLLMLEKFEKVLSEEKLDLKGTIKNRDVVYNFLNSDHKDLIEVCNLFLSDRIQKLKKASAPTIKVNITHNTNWLETSLNSDEYNEEELKGILNAYKKKRKYYLIKDKLINLTNDTNNLESLLNVLDDYEFNLDELKKGSLPLYSYFSFSNIKDEKLKIEQDQYVDNFLKKMKTFETMPITNLSNNLSDKIRSYQEKGIKWLKTLYDLKLGAILADDMGLGKTLQTIGLISNIDSNKPILIICPKSVTYNWENEIKLWSNNEQVEVLVENKNIRQKKISEMKKNKRIIYIASYDSLKKDIDLFENKEFSLLVADEAQYIKNAFAQKSRAIKKIKADFHLALTGTPIENSLTDLWSIFDLIMKGYLSSYEKFKQKYLKDDDTKNDEYKKLKNKVKPFILRRLKGDVLKDLPPKETIVQKISMNQEERKLYDASLLEAKKLLGIENKKSLSIFQILTRLREICVDSSSFFENIKEIPSKFEYVISLINNAIKGGHKILVFSSFKVVLEHLKNELEKEGIKSYTINGDVSAIDRIEYSYNFNTNDDVKVMLVSLKAGGTGLNLHGADYVIHLDPWWNFASEEQATDRAHRIGQNRPVTVFKLAMHDSIEEKILKLQQKKKELNQEIVQIDSANDLNFEDIKFLLG